MFKFLFFFSSVFLFFVLLIKNRLSDCRVLGFSFYILVF